MKTTDRLARRREWHFCASVLLCALGRALLQLPALRAASDRGAQPVGQGNSFRGRAEEDLHPQLPARQRANMHLGAQQIAPRPGQARSGQILFLALVQNLLSGGAIRRRRVRLARAGMANASAPDGSTAEQVLDQGQKQDLAAASLARAWGDLLGAEVHVRPLPRGQLRMEVLFSSAAEGITLADRLGAAIARGSKGR